MKQDAVLTTLHPTWRLSHPILSTSAAALDALDALPQGSVVLGKSMLLFPSTAH